jgi:hypothetical protein
VQSRSPTNPMQDSPNTPSRTLIQNEYNNC